MGCDDCRSCPGCGACSGCGQDRALTPLESALLELFSETPFVPVVTDMQTGRMLLPDPGLDQEAAGLALRQLQRRGYAAVDPDDPLPNAGYSGYEGWRHGSAALTRLGQEAADDLEYGSACPESL